MVEKAVGLMTKHKPGNVYKDHQARNQGCFYLDSMITFEGWKQRDDDRLNVSLSD